MPGCRHGGLLTAVVTRGNNHATSPFPQTRRPADSPRASGARYRRRLEVCAACEHHGGSRCLKSDMLLTLRARRKESTCPVDRWSAMTRCRLRSGRIPGQKYAAWTRAPGSPPGNWSMTPPGSWLLAGRHRRGHRDRPLRADPAQQIACMRHLPLLACRIAWSHAAEAVVEVGNGWRLCNYDRQPFRKVLLVDDTAWLGRSMNWATAIVRKNFPEVRSCERRSTPQFQPGVPGRVGLHLRRPALPGVELI